MYEIGLIIFSMGRGKGRRIIIKYGGGDSAGNTALKLLRLVMRDSERCGEVEAKQKNEQYRDICKDKQG